MILRIGQKNDRRGGFTLIELILVMAILVSLIALAAPRLNQFLRGRYLQAEAERLVGTLEFARTEAINTGTPMVVVFSIEEGIYAVGPAAGFERLDERTWERHLAEGIHFFFPDEPQISTPTQAQTTGEFQSQYYIGFLPDGTIMEGSLTTIGLEDQNGRRLYVVPSIWMDQFHVVDEEEYQQEVNQWAAFEQSF